MSVERSERNTEKKHRRAKFYNFAVPLFLFANHREIFFQRREGKW